MKLSLDKNVNVPNMLTVLRMVLIVPLMYFLLRQDYIMVGILLLLSALSDMLDGLIARRLHQVTALGRILDPMADKLTLIAVVIGLNVLYPDMVPFTLILFCKEMLMLTGGAFLLRMRLHPPAAQWYGKLSTVIFYAAVTVLILLKAVWGYTNRMLTMLLLAVTTTFMLFSLVRYSILFVGMLRRRKQQQSMQKSTTINPTTDEPLTQE